jgi:hypothetical protein
LQNIDLSRLQRENVAIKNVLSMQAWSNGIRSISSVNGQFHL